MNRRNLLSGVAAFPYLHNQVLAQDDETESAATCNCACVKLEDREGVIILSGRGEQLSELIELSAGVYRLEIETEPVDEDDDYIQVLFYRSGTVNPMGNSDYSLNGSVPVDNPKISSAAPIEVDGQYGILVRLHDGPWKIGISPM